MRILIVDDHPLIRIALKHILADEFCGAEFGEACNATEALEQVRNQDWAAMVLEVTMPGRSGLDIIGELKDTRPNLPILILTSQPEDQFALRCLKAGADGYLTKETASAELAQAMRQVMTGSKFVTPSVVEKLTTVLNVDPSRPAHELLSNREFEVLRMLSIGTTVKEIAGKVGVSIKTISTYRTRILLKMHLKTNADLVRYCVENKLT